MIGSRTKRVSFQRWLREAGPVETGALVCPIGAAGRPDKRPEVIAAFVGGGDHCRQSQPRGRTVSATRLAYDRDGERT